MKQLEEKTSGLHALIWHAITTKGFDIPNPKQLSDEIWDDIEHSFKTALEEVEKKIDKLIEEDKKLAEIFDTDEWWWYKRTGEPYSSIRTRTLEKLKSQLKGE